MYDVKDIANWFLIYNSYMETNQGADGMSNLKFQKFLRPNDELELTLKWNKEKSRMEFQLKTDNETCGKGLVVIA